MMVATPARLGNKADGGRSNAQHVLILAFCSAVGGITNSEPVATDLTDRLGKETSGILDYGLTHNWSDGESRIRYELN